jgi:hypothetical protein
MLKFDEKLHQYTYKGQPRPSVSALLDLVPKINLDGSNNILRRCLNDEQIVRYRQNPRAKFQNKTDKELALGFWGYSHESMNQSADHGTVVHNALEDFANGESLDSVTKRVIKQDEELKEKFIEYTEWYIFPDAKTGYLREIVKKEPIRFASALKKFEQGIKFIQEAGYIIIGQEEKVHNDELKYAGTFDLRTEKDGLKYIMDYKTSRWSKNKKSNTSKLNKYGLQMDAYEMCIKEEFAGKAIVWLFEDRYELHFTKTNHDLIRRLINIYYNKPAVRELIEEFNAGADTKALAEKHGKTEEELIQLILNLNLLP